jgi:hypothetical protein
MYECFVLEDVENGISILIEWDSFKGLNDVILIGGVGVWLVALIYLKHITIYFIIMKCDSYVNNLQNLLNTKIYFLALLFLFLLQAFA